MAESEEHPEVHPDLEFIDLQVTIGFELMDGYWRALDEWAEEYLIGRGTGPGPQGILSTLDNIQGVWCRFCEAWHPTPVCSYGDDINTA